MLLDLMTNFEVPSIGGADPRVLAATGVVFASFMAVQFMRKKSKGPYPPGPMRMPIVGNLFQIGDDTHLKLTEWSKKYGKVYSIKLGVKEVIVVNGWETFREAAVLNAEAFAGRPDYYTFRHIICNGKTLAFNTYSPRFKNHKKILVNGLSTFLKSNDPPVDVAVVEEGKRLVEILHISEGKPIDPYNPILCSCLYVICGLLFGFDSWLCDDRETVAEIGNVDETRDAEGAASNIVDFFPLLRPFLMGTLKGMLEECDSRMALIGRLEKEHREEYDENALRDLMDHLIKAADNLTQSELESGLTKEHIMSTAFTLLNAGSDTLAGMLYWGLLYCAVFPDIQAKIHAEIDNVVGSDRPPRLEDRPHLQYTEAFFNEVMRYCVLTPFVIPHATTKDVVLKGYHIPAETTVFFNMWSISRDETVWDIDPNKFDPTRYLNSDGIVDKSKLENFYPFSAGKRRCIGEAMGRMEWMLFFTAIMQRNRVVPPPGATLDINPKFGFSMLPKHYEIIFKSRESSK